MCSVGVGCVCAPMWELITQWFLLLQAYFKAELRGTYQTQGLGGRVGELGSWVWGQGELRHLGFASE